MPNPALNQTNTMGVRTLRTLDTSDPRQFGTMSLVLKCLTFFCRCRDTRAMISDHVSLRHFGTSAELSQHFMKGPKCPTDTSALVPKCLGRSAAHSCSCITSPPHVTSAPSIAIFRQRLKTYCMYEIIPDIHI